jgi:S1-C subfamily serine protease
MKRFLFPITILMCMSLSGCIGIDPVATVETAILRHDLDLVRQVIIKEKRGISFKSARIYGKRPEDPNVLQVNVIMVNPDSDAEKTGMQVGDEVLEVNGKEPYLGGDVIAPFFAPAGDQIKFKMKRGQSIYTATLKPL